jgi:hypothetical protein
MFVRLYVFIWDALTQSQSSSLSKLKVDGSTEVSDESITPQQEDVIPNPSRATDGPAIDQQA